MREVLSTNNAFCWAGKGEYLVDFSCQSKSYLRTSTTIEATNNFLERHQEQPWLHCILISAGIEAVSRSEQKGEYVEGFCWVEVLCKNIYSTGAIALIWGIEF